MKISLRWLMLAFFAFALFMIAVLFHGGQTRPGNSGPVPGTRSERLAVSQQDHLARAFSEREERSLTAELALCQVQLAAVDQVNTQPQEDVTAALAAIEHVLANNEILEREASALRSELALAKARNAALSSENLQLQTDVQALRDAKQRELGASLAATSQQAGVEREHLLELKRENKLLQLKTHQNGCLPEVTESYFCPEHVSDFKRWVGLVGSPFYPLVTKLSWWPLRGEFDPNVVEIIPRWYCDKVKQSLAPLENNPGLTNDDIVIGVFTGERLFYSRALAFISTVGRWWDNVILYAATEDVFLPVTGMADKYGLKPDYVDHSTTVQLLNLYLLKEMYEKHPDKKWYNTVGCDTFIHPDVVMRMLSQYDPEEEWLLHTSAQEYTEDHFKSFHFDAASFPDSIVGKDNSFKWQSGAVGFWMSQATMKKLIANFDKLADAIELEKNTRNGKLCFCPDVIICLWMSLLGIPVTPFLPGYEASASAIDGSEKEFVGRSNRWLFHYMSPRKFLALDHMFTHEKMDKLINGGDVEKVLSFARTFIDQHFDVLRRTQSLLKEVTKHGVPYEVNWVANMEDVPSSKQQTMYEARRARGYPWN